MADSERQPGSWARHSDTGHQRPSSFTPVSLIAKDRAAAEVRRCQTSKEQPRLARECGKPLVPWGQRRNEVNALPAPRWLEKSCPSLSWFNANHGSWMLLLLGTAHARAHVHGRRTSVHKAILQMRAAHLVKGDGERESRKGCNWSSVTLLRVAIVRHVSAIDHNPIQPFSLQELNLLGLSAFFGSDRP